MNEPDDPQAALRRAQIRLAQSRAELVAHMRGDPAGAQKTSASAADDIFGPWWHRHPLKMVLDVAGPLLVGQARQHPVAAMLLAAAAGAALVLLRPWRALPWAAWAGLRALPLQTLLAAIRSVLDRQGSRSHDRSEPAA